MEGRHATEPQLDVPYMLRLAKLMADELRMKIVLELNGREMSPKGFYDEFGGIFEELAARIRSAMDAGTIDARDDRRFTWAPLRLDSAFESPKDAEKQP